MLENLREELNINKHHGIRTKVSLITYRIGFYEYFICRNYIIKKFCSLVYRFLKILCIFISCTDLPPKQVYIGYGLRLPHGFDGIKINSNSKIGENCTLFHNVTLGAIEGQEYRSKIEIGNNVYIGTHSLILGNTIIGDNCKIGAGTKIIDKIIPENSTVINEVDYRIINKNA